MEDWKQRLRTARENKGLSKTAFAAAVGISNATATDWEKSVDAGGIKEISGPKLTKASEVLGIDPHWLLHGKPGTATRQTDLDDAPVQLVDQRAQIAAADEMLRVIAEMIEIYRLANAAEKRRIDRAFLEARSRIAADKAKLRTS